MLFHPLRLGCFSFLVLAQASAATLYGVTFQKEFVEIDRDTGAVLQVIGGVSDASARVNSGAVDSLGRLLYVDFDGTAVFEIDPETGSTQSLVDITGLPIDVRSVAIDSADTLYVAGLQTSPQVSSALWTINLATGEATVVGNLQRVQCSGLAFDDKHVLYCLDVINGFFEVDATTGETTKLAEYPLITSSDEAQTLEFDPGSGKMLGARRSLYEIDLEDYSITEIGALEGGLDIRGLFLVEENDVPCGEDSVLVEVAMHCDTCADDSTFVRIKNANKDKLHSFMDLPNDSVAALSGCVPDDECIHVKIKDFSAGDGVDYEIFYDGVKVVEESDFTRTQKVERVGPYCDSCGEGSVPVRVAMHCDTCADDGTFVHIRDANRVKFHSFMDLPNDSVTNLAGCVPDNECIRVQIRHFYAGDGIDYEILYDGVKVIEESDFTRTQKVERVGPFCG